MMVMQTAATALSSLLILAAPRLIQVGGHRDRMSAFNSVLPAASRATAACRAIDFQLHLAD